MNEPTAELSLEQELNHRIFSDQVKQLSPEQTQELLIELHRQMFMKDNIYKQLFLSQSQDLADSLFS
ncbi:MAG: NblA/ycf18 family protein [Cyanobacteria bacterium P01_A01_bin.84]